MKGLWVIFAIIGISVIFGNSAFAQSVYTINIPTGAASQSAPYFSQNE